MLLLVFPQACYCWKVAGEALHHLTKLMDLSTATVRDLRKVARIAANSREREICGLGPRPDLGDCMDQIRSLRSLATSGQRSDLVNALSDPYFSHIAQSVTSPWA